jgi:hypothetical protein
MPPPRAQFHDSMTSALNAASSVLVIGRCSLPLHALLHPDHPALLGTMLSRRSLGRCSLQRKRFSSDERLQLLHCSCPLSALLLRIVTVIDHSGRAMAQHDRHKLVARIMKRHFSAVAYRLLAIGSTMSVIANYIFPMKLFSGKSILYLYPYLRRASLQGYKYL